jgi:hypothetical protein
MSSQHIAGMGEIENGLKLVALLDGRAASF